MSELRESRGGLVAATLAGAWRAKPPALTCTVDELEAVAPLLLGSGAAPVGWWKARESGLRESAAASGLRAAYRAQVLQNAVREREIEDVFGRLHEAGVEALLVKGWAAARLYPAEGLRPFGDIDVCVRRGQAARAAAALEASEARLWVDLHDGFETLDDAAATDPAELFERAVTVRLGTTGVRVPCSEDHLRILCVHLLKHGAWRPLWLCDVAALIEGRGAGFDWARVTGKNRRRARWIACAVGLAHQLLGARIDDTPLAGAAREMPRWLAPEVLKQWDAPFAVRQSPMRHRAPMASYLRHPAGVLTDLRNRWPNPIEATVRVGGAFNELPRWPFQLANCFARAAHFVSTLRGAPARLSETHAPR